MASEVNKEALQKLLDSGNVKNCLQFFQGMPEKMRRECFPMVKKFWDQVRKASVVEGPPGTYRRNPLLSIATCAYFATASGSEIIKAKRAGYPDADNALEILVDRRPDWVDQWIESLLGESYFWRHYRLIQRLIEAKLAQKPDTPRYYLAMISGLNERMKKVDLVKELQRAPDVLKEDVWKLFEYDGDGENSLANTERTDKSWIDAFVKLMEQGKLPRAKLLESTMQALERDFNHFRARWYYDFFDRLEPTDKELKKLGPRILGLLGASAPNVATWALGRVEKLASSGAFDTDTLCHACEPILRARAKGTVLSVLKLLERQATAQPKAAAQVAATVTLALNHEAADVQKAVLRLLESISSPQNAQIREAVVQLQPTLAASVRGQATKWLASGESAKEMNSVGAGRARHSPAVPTQPKLPKITKQLESLFALDLLRDNLKKPDLSIPAATFDGTELPRLKVAQQLSPIENLEALVDVCATVIEDNAAIDDAERCIDGLLRLCASKPANVEHFTAPLLKRIRKLIPKGHAPFCGIDPANDVMGLFYAFCTGTVIAPIHQAYQSNFEFEGKPLRSYGCINASAMKFLSERSVSVARRIAAGQAGQLLSTPTHSGGWIDPRVLAERVNAASVKEPDHRDCILAMLRLAPEHRAAGLKLLKPNSAEWAQAVAYALGADTIKIGKTAALWAAAARARSPWQDDAATQKKHPSLGPDAAEAARLAFRANERTSGKYTFYDAYFSVEPKLPKKIDSMLLTVDMHRSQRTLADETAERGGLGAKTVGAVRWTATIWPLARESFFIASVHETFSNLDWWEARWYYRALLEPLVDSGTPLRYAGLIFLGGMLAAKEPGEAGLATDIAIRAIEDGRLGSDNLGQALALLLSTKLIKPGRWSKTLAEVARASQVHAAVVQLALQNCFVDAKVELPNDATKLLELLNELTLELGVPISNEPCRTWLASSALTGKSAKLAKSLLASAATDESKSVTRAVLEQAIAQRTQAAASFLSS